MVETRNKKVIKKIAVRYYKTSTQRNVFVILAIIMSSFLLTAVFSLGVDFYNTMKRQQVMAEGTNRDIIITNPKKEQLDIAESLPQCKFSGIEARCGIAIECNKKMITYGMYWKDKTNWEKQTLEAVERMEGKYPEREDEILLSEWTLKELGIENYEIGMKIPVTYSIQKNEHTKDFSLSGYYKDYSALLNPGSEKILVSEKFYRTASKEMDTQSAELGITLNSKFISEKQMMNLEKEFNLEDNQGFYYNEELIYIVTLLYIGMLLITLLIMFCSYLLVYNILYISFSREVRTYGLLKTLGMTNKQMSKMMIYQVILLIFTGVPIGLALGGIAAVKFAPYILRSFSPDIKLLIEGGMEPFVFISAAVFTIITVFVSSFKPVKMAVKSTPLDAIKYQQITLKRNIKKGRQGGKPYRMAIYNITCNKRKSILVFASLFLGITIFMLVNTYTNSINKEDYIKAYMPYDAILNNPTRNDSGNLGEQIFDADLINRIKSVEGVRNVEIVTSDTINVGFNEELFAGEYLKKFCALWMDRSYEEVLGQLEKDPLDFYGCLIAVNQKQLERLTKGQNIDLTGFDDGKTCILQSDIPISGIKNKNIAFNLAEQKEIFNMKAAGVVEKNLSSFSGIAPNIYVSEKAAGKFIGSPWVEKVYIMYEQSYDQVAEKKIKLLIQGSKAGFSSRIEKAESVGNSKSQISLLGNGLALIIAIIGILNFANVILTNICQRKKDFAVLNSIGMTHRQIRQMLVIEGLAYGIGTVILVLTIGVWLSMGVFSILKEPYMTMHFPFFTVGVVILALLIICSVLPLMVYRTSNKRGAKNI